MFQLGAAPTSKPKNVTVNWQRLFQGADAKTVLHERFAKLYSVPASESTIETKAKEHWIETWRSLRIDLKPFKVSSAMLRVLFRRLRKGKGSPDGCTAEMFCELPEEAVESLALFFTMLLASLCIPLSWIVVLATLIPKLVGAADLDKFRGISCLCTARKLLGYLWMRMLPP